jgi:hypothetical protein
LATLLASFVPIVDILGKVLAPIFVTMGKYVERLAPLLVALGEVFLILFEAISPLLDVLMELITPLLAPLVSVFKLLAAVIKPFIPLITLFANILGAILLPIVTGLSIGFKFLVDGIIGFINLLSSIPFIGDAFKGANKGLKDFNKQFTDVNDKMAATTDSSKLMASQFSKKINSNPVDGAGKAIEKVGKTAETTGKKVKTFLEDAVNIQKSFIDSTNITGLLDANNNEIVQSMVYIEGRFKTVVSSATKSSGDIVAAFKGKLTGLKGFYENLNTLIAGKLDPELIAQISSAGVEAGGATAQAIVDSGAEGITSLNKTFTGIKKIAGDIGFKTAKVMQDTGSEIGNGLIDGLAAQSEKLNAVATQMGKDFANGFDAGTKQKDAPSIENVIPKGYAPTLTTFIGGRKAMAEGQTSFAPDAYSLVMGKDVRNPFKGLSNPYARGTKQSGGTFQEFRDWAATNAAKQAEFQRDINIARDYKIAINVAPGANQAAIGQALVEAIQEYERKTGKKLR